MALHDLMAPSQRPVSWRLDYFMFGGQGLQSKVKLLSHGAFFSQFTLWGSRSTLGGAQGTTVLCCSQPTLPTYDLTLSSQHVCLVQVGGQPSLRKSLLHSDAIQSSGLSTWTWGLRGRGKVSAGRQMPFSNMNKKLQQRMMGIEKSIRHYQDCRERGHGLSDGIIFQSASNNLRGPSRLSEILFRICRLRSKE